MSKETDFESEYACAEHGVTACNECQGNKLPTGDFAPRDVEGNRIFEGDVFWYGMPAGRGVILCKYKAVRFYMSQGYSYELMLEAESLVDKHYIGYYRTKNGHLHTELFKDRALKVDHD